MWLVFLLLLWLSPAASNQETGSCSQPQPLCCLEMDHHCKRGSCYCDEFCHVVPDCCPDHHDVCNSRDSHAGSFLPPTELDTMNDRGPSTNGSGHADMSAVTPAAGTTSEGLFWTTDLTEISVPSHIPLETQTLGTQTSDRAFIPGGTISEAETRETKTIFPAAKTRALVKTTPSKSMVVTMPLETPATRSRPMGSEMTTVETVTGKDLLKAVFDTLCTFDSSEEAKTIMVDYLTLAYSAEAKALSSESSTSSDNSVPAIAPQALLPNITALAKALVPSNITILKVINCSFIEIEATATIPGTSDINHSPTGGKALSAPETSALPDSNEDTSHFTRTTFHSAPAEILSTASATVSTTPDSTLTISSTTETETTAAKATPPSGKLMTVSTNFLEGNSTLSVGTSHTKVSEAVTRSTEAWSTVGKATSPAGFSAMVYSLSEVATIMNSTPSETSTTGSTFSGPVPLSRNPLPSAHLTTASSSQVINTTLAKTTASAKTSKMASTAAGKPSRATPTTVPRWTDVTAGRNGGFLLLRLSVVSPEDLTDPTVTERLMQQFHRELQVLTPPIQVSLLRVRRG
uniref:Mucin 20, cell surface associated n=1 Tax=Sus scrofa TaxID=9823 RepID=A0A8D0WX39_PIG